jgi:hypothetical protein
VVDAGLVDEQRKAFTAATQRALTDLETYFVRLDFLDPAACRDALLEFVPTLVQQYGDVTATLALDAFEEQRTAAGFDDGWSAAMPDELPEQMTTTMVRRTAGSLWTPTPQDMLAGLEAAVQRMTAAGYRNALAGAAASDPQKPRYARVPTGATTCEFCLMLSSRGFVYASAELAGKFNHYHSHCDCLVVTSWDKRPALVGYDPAALYDRYKASRATSGSATASRLEHAKSPAEPRLVVPTPDRALQLVDELVTSTARMRAANDKGRLDGAIAWNQKRIDQLREQLAA